MKLQLKFNLRVGVPSLFDSLSLLTYPTRMSMVSLVELPHFLSSRSSPSSIETTAGLMALVDRRSLPSLEERV